jgi:NHL repeat
MNYIETRQTENVFIDLGVNMQWNMTGVTVAGVTGVAGSAANQLNQPWNLFVDSAQNLYIADSVNHRIQFWRAGASSGTTIAGVSGSAGSSATQLNTPNDVFVDANGNFYVADHWNSRIQFFRNGTTTGTAASTGWGGIGRFRGVHVVSPGFIYAIDNSNNAFWRNNTVPFGYQGAGGGSNQLNSPGGITVDTTMNVGYVYIANTNQHTIVQWIPGNNFGTVVAGSNGVSGSSSSTMAYPLAVRIDRLGNLFVVDNNNHRIQLYCRYPGVSSTARTIIGTGSQGSTPTTLTFPTGLALDSDLNIYVADTSNHRIQKFTRIV